MQAGTLLRDVSDVWAPITEPAFVSDHSFEAPPVTRCGHQVAFGVLVSRKTLYGPGNKYPRRYPKIERAHEAVPTCGALSIVHYSQDDSDGLHSALVDAVMACSRPGAVVSGVQVNVPWPDVEHLAGFARDVLPKLPSLRVVLQVNLSVLTSLAYPRAIVDYLRQYAWCVTDVLFDGSAGTGRPLDEATLLDLVAAVSDRLPLLGVGVAGGLGPGRMDTVERIVLDFPNVSFCAEGRLRDGGPEGGDLVHERARLYLVEARDMVEASLKLANR